MTESSFEFGTVRLRAAEFVLRFREGELSLPELLSVQESDGVCESVYRITLTLRQQKRQFCVGQSFRDLGGGVERRLWIEREPGDEATPDGFCAAALLVAPSGVERVSIPMARLRPGTPVREILRRPRVFPSPVEPADDMYDICLTAPDCLTGAVVLEGDPSGGSIVAVTPLPDRCAVVPRVYGRDGVLLVEHEFQKELWLRDGERHEVARQTMFVSTPPCANGTPRLASVERPSAGTSLAEHPATPLLRTSGQLLSAAGYVPPIDRAAWARETIILEVEPGFEGGLVALTAKLDAVRAQGFNTVYLMPWHRGSYGTLDYLQMEPALGTLADLRRLTDAAHDRGLKVLFDLLLVIAADGSSYLVDHPDWFYRDANGTILSHPVWGQRCLDPAAPGFRQFLIEYAVRCVREWGADGFRVDSSAHRGGCWHSPNGLQPHEHSYAVFTLLRELRAAMRAVNPEAILLAECFGPEQAAICDLVGFQWIIWLDWLMAQLAAGTCDGATLQRMIAEHWASLPPGTWLTTYTHTHDTLAFSKRDPQGPPVDALFATLALLSAGTMVFGGGWGMRPRPAPTEVAGYRGLFSMKTRLGGVATHEVGFPVVPNEALFVAQRPSRIGPACVVTNFSGVTQSLPFAGRRTYSRLNHSGPDIAPYDTVLLLG